MVVLALRGGRSLAATALALPRTHASDRWPSAPIGGVPREGVTFQTLHRTLWVQPICANMARVVYGDCCVVKSREVPILRNGTDVLVMLPPEQYDTITNLRLHRS